MASPNTRAKLISTAIKVEPAVKKEDDVKKEPIVNTRRADRSWPKSAKLVHLDRTPCSEECIANNHYGKYPDFPDDSPAEPHVTQSKNDTSAMDIASNAAYATKHVNLGRNTDDNTAPLNVMTNKDTNQGNTRTEQIGVPIQRSASRLLTGTLDVEPLHKADSVMPTNTDESMEDGVVLPDLGSKQSEPGPQAAALINLPDEKADEVTLPDVHVEFGQDELASDFLDNDVDNSALLGVNVAPVTDFAREMAQEEGVDRDLELELENLMFLKEQNSKRDNKEMNDKIEITENHQRAENPKDKGANLQMLCQIILTSRNQPGILCLHIPQPPPDPQKASGRPPNMVFTKAMDPVIHRTTDVKSVDNFYHPEAN